MITDFERRKRVCGFTLIEILIAMAISSVLVLGVHAGYSQARLMCQRSQSQARIYRQVQMVTEMMRQELLGVYFWAGAEDAGEQGKKVCFELLADGDEGGRISFCTTTPWWRTGASCSKIARVSYLYSKDDQGGFVLERSEQSYSAEMPIAKAESEVILRGLSGFCIWVLTPDQQQWQRVYQLQSEKPKAVKVELRWAVNGENQDTVVDAVFGVQSQKFL